MERTDTEHESGTVLFAMTLLTIVISGLAVVFYEVAGQETAFVSLDVASVEALHVAEAGIDTSIDRLNRGLGGTIDPPVDFASGSFGVEDTDGGPGRRILRSTGIVQGRQRRVEAVVEDRPGIMRANLSGGISAGRFVYILGSSGSVTLDGRDHDHDGDTLVGLGRFGVSTADRVLAFGTAKVGGYGVAPKVNPVQADGVLDELISYGDSFDNDGDGTSDEERFNGLDDDGDGKIDEDLSGYPSNADRLLGLEETSLREAAIRMGTYFTSQLDYELWLLAEGGNVPGGRIIYLEFETLSPTLLGPNLNAEPSIIVHHADLDLATMEDLSGRFKGLILADNVWHFNGGVQIIGAVHTTGYQIYSASDPGTVVELLYSEDVLSRLPEARLDGSYQVISWRELADAAPVVP
jgi:hypothetical protein